MSNSVILKDQSNFLMVTDNNLTNDTIENLKAVYSKKTIKEYTLDLKQYKKWLDDQMLSYELPHTSTMVANFASFMAKSGLKPSTISRRVRAISWLHKTSGLESPTKTQLVRDTLRGIKNRRAAEGLSNAEEQKAPILVDDLKALLLSCGSDNLGKRDKAMLLIGFFAALRRSELVALQKKDIAVTLKGADIRIGKSKTDQEGVGSYVSILRASDPNLCPVMSLVDWYKTANIEEGYVFRQIHGKSGKVLNKGISGQTVSDRIKHYCYINGLSPADYAGHSLRSGMLTSAAEKGSELIPLMQHARHKNPAQTMSYIQKANRYKNNPTEGLI